jgi:poly(3-hydroxybutyrate) depolymerase
VPAARLLPLFLTVTTLGTAAAVFVAKRTPPQPPSVQTETAFEPAPTTATTEPAADWCAPGYEPIGGGCLALSSTQSPQPLLVYLHGRYASDVTAEEVDRQRRLGTAATARGFAVLALRGRLGECASLVGWFCWPSNEQNADRAAVVVASWTGALAEAQRRARSKNRFVLGFSNGGYFAGLLAVRGLFDAEAFVIAHGGPVEPVRALPRALPLLLLSADDDIAQDDMIRLDGELTRERWPHDSYARAGAHGLTDGDIDAALTFFTRAHETLPLQPPLALHRPTHHPHDAGNVDAEAPAQATEIEKTDSGSPSEPLEQGAAETPSAGEATE